jgi:hypothetical protein
MVIRMLARRWSGLENDLAEARADAASAQAHVAQLTTELVAVHRRREAAEADAAALHTELDAAAADRDGLRDILRETEEELESESAGRVDAEADLAWERHDRAAERAAVAEKHQVEVEAAAETAVRRFLDGFTDRLARPVLLPGADPAIVAAERVDTLFAALRLAEHHDPDNGGDYADLRAQLATRVRDAFAECLLDMSAWGRRMAAELALAPADDRPVPAPPEVETVDDLAAGVG